LFAWLLHGRSIGPFLRSSFQLLAFRAFTFLDFFGCDGINLFRFLLAALTAAGCSVLAPARSRPIAENTVTLRTEAAVRGAFLLAQAASSPFASSYLTG